MRAKPWQMINWFSPLAARLAAEAGLNPATLRGTGPRGKIMAADVRAALRPADGPARRVQTPLAPRDTRHATRVDNFYLYSLEANMAYLAAISTPIAEAIINPRVQPEESPRQCRPRTLVFSSSSILTRLE